ncbi:hypothetical protein TWF481_010342 [Arthrobotrys musiformis]|uniref:Uncharacterized protein n=1 Tax=Arthrobotrys musiformis TaxID=47236 RepID=A0AAV9W1W1_9PEZI
MSSSQSSGGRRRSALITGCSAGGIGASLAQSLVKSGYLVFASARNTNKIPEALSSRSDVVLVELDVTSTDSVIAALEVVKSSLVERHCKGLDVLVNNSGLGIYGPVLDVDIEQAKALSDVNFFGVIRTVKAFAPLLVEAKGAIVNISSASGEINDPYASIYNASKAALNIASEA